MSKSRQQNFIKGAAILSVSTIIVKAVGLFFSMPLASILDEAAYGYFFVAYDVFAVFNAIATAGLPVAVSRMVSAAYAKGRKKQADRIFGVAILIFFILGLASALVMAVFSRPLAALMNYPGADLAILALSPTIFFCAIMSAIRGYFQGRSNMTPTALSQVIEAVTKLVMGIGLAYYVVTAFGESASSLSAAAAILGVSLSASLGTVYLLIYKRKQNKIDREDTEKGDETVTRRKEIAWALIKFAVPITIGSSFLYVLDLIDTSIIGGALQSIEGVTEAVASGYNGYWGAAKKLFDLPGAIVIALSTSLLPILTAAFVKKNQRGVNRMTSLSIRFTFLVTIPCAVGYVLFGRDITALFFPQDTAAGAGTLLTIAAVGVIFNGMLYTTNAIMQSLGHTVVPIINMAIGGVVKILMNYFLVRMPEININGAALSTAVSLAITMILNLIAVYRRIPRAEKPWKMFGQILLASAVMGGLTYLINIGLAPLVGGNIAVIISIIAAMAIYIAAAVVFKAITYDEVRMMPMGEKIARVLRLKPSGADEGDYE